MGNDATIDLKVKSDAVKRELDASEQAFNKFGQNVKRVAEAIALAFAVKKLIDWSKAMFQLYSTQEEAEKRLEIVLRNREDALNGATDDLKAYAAELQRVTTYGDEVTISTMATVAAFHEIRAENFKEVIKQAQNLDAVFRMGLEPSARMLARAMEDPSRGLMMLRRIGVSFTDDQIALIQALNETGHAAEAQALILERVAQSVGGAAEEMAQRPAARIQQFKNRLGDIGETIGAALIPAIEKVLPLVEWFAQRVEKAVPVCIEWAMSLAEVFNKIWDFVKPALEWLSDAVVTTFTVVETAIQSWYDVSVLTFEKFSLAVVQMWEEAKHILIDAMPQYLAWLGRNWQNVFRDIWEYVKTVLTNMWANLKEFFAGVWDFLRGKDHDWRFRGLEEGFKGTMEELPRIAARQKTLLERSLELDISRAQDRIARRFQDNLAVNRAAAGAFWGSFVPADAAQGARKDPGAADRYGSGHLAGQDKPGAKADAGTFRSSFEDLVALNRRITQAAAGGGAESKDKKLLEQQQLANDFLRDMNSKQKDANDYLSDVSRDIAVVAEKIDKVGTL